MARENALLTKILKGRRWKECGCWANLVSLQYQIIRFSHCSFLKRYNYLFVFTSCSQNLSFHHHTYLDLFIDSSCQKCIQCCCDTAEENDWIFKNFQMWWLFYACFYIFLKEEVFFTFCVCVSLDRQYLKGQETLGRNLIFFSKFLFLMIIEGLCETSY